LTHENQVLTPSIEVNEPSFDVLFKTWYAPLVRYAFSFTEGDQVEAEELVQDAFVKLWSQWNTIDIQHSAKAYLYRMVHNLALNRLRSGKVQVRYIQHQTRQMEHEFESAHEIPELQDKIQKALKNLPAQCRQVFELSRFEELKYREIADQLGISIKTVETHMGKALRVMRLELAEYLTLLAALLHFIHF
jgi:RNA polymerase sigma-70 factor (ECF subfamily)